MSTEPTVLVIDDTATNTKLLDAVLTPSGYRVVTADSGQAGLAAAATEAPDLVLLDIRMPDMNGYEVCRRLREDPATAQLPIIMITASGNEEKVRAIDAGADDFVLRPFDRAELLARVRSLIKVKHYRDTIDRQAEELAAWNKTLEGRVAEQLEELDHLRRLRRFLPSQLADAVLHSDQADLLEPHRREVAVLMCHLKGFTALSSESQPEDALQVLGEFHGQVGALVRTYGATVGLMFGGTVMLLLNDPVPRDAPARDAVLLASDLRDAVGPLVEEWARRGHDLGVSVGIAFGFATLGTIGFDGRYDYSAIGPVVNLAAQLGERAVPGEILLSQRVHAEVESVVAAEPRDDAWALIGVTEAPRTTAGEGVVEIDLLGPIQLRHEGEVVELRSSRERQVLALLAVHLGRIVTVERLADEIWDGAPADTAISALRVHVSRLRKTLSTAGVGTILHTEATGYVLRLDGADSLDVTRFEALAARGSEQLASGAYAAAAATLRSALGLWRGGVLDDVPVMPSITALRLRLDELRLVAIEDCLDAELARGRHREVQVELEELVVAHPLRERFWGQRMLAMYRSGRQSEALRAFQEFRDLLVESSGLEPSTELARLERRIVAKAPELELTSQ